jgi:hypothetical protein
MRQWFLTFFGSLLKKIFLKKILLASLKTLTKNETRPESGHRSLSRLTISVIGWFSTRDHLSLDRGKVGLNIHVMGGLRNNFQNHIRVTEQVLQQQTAFCMLQLQQAL